jgi:pimeloyl-ACP methyl ester carboxylesterase
MRARAVRRSLTRRPSLDHIISDGLRGAAADPSAIDPSLIEDSVALARLAGTRDVAVAFAEAARSNFGLVLRGQAFRQLLAQVECPVLLMHGACDQTIPLSFAQRVAHDHPRWQLHVFPTLGHMLHLEDPTAWIKTLDEWLTA